MYKKDYERWGYQVWEVSQGFLVKIWSNIIHEFTDRLILVPFDCYSIKPGARLTADYLGDEMGAMIYRIGDMGLRNAVVMRTGELVM